MTQCTAANNVQISPARLGIAEAVTFKATIEDSARRILEAGQCSRTHEQGEVLICGGI